MICDCVWVNRRLCITCKHSKQTHTNIHTNMACDNTCETRAIIMLLEKVCLLIYDNLKCNQNCMLIIAARQRTTPLHSACLHRLKLVALYNSGDMGNCYATTKRQITRMYKFISRCGETCRHPWGWIPEIQIYIHNGIGERAWRHHPWVFS